MNIDLSKLKISNNVYSVRIKIVSGDKIQEITNLYNNRIINYDYTFKDSTDYIVVISVAQFGKQIYKKKYSFTYHSCDKYILDDNITIINGLKNNNISNKMIISDLNYNFDINPLASYRNEGSKLSVFVNGNIYLLKGNLKKIFMAIKKGESLTEIGISEDNIIKELELLILKGCVICYE